MSVLTRTTALIGCGALLAVPTAVLLSGPAQADVERNGTCGGGVYEFSVDRENGGFEVSADLDSVAPGSRWKVVLRHDGKRYFKDVRKADNEGDLDVERFRNDTAGKDTFRLRATRVNGAGECATRITVD